MATPQFGLAEPGRRYRDRPAAFGVLARDGKVAVVRVEKPGQAAWFDLPGGAIDPGEDDSAALVREFGEETGLNVAPGERLGHADQYFINDGEGCDNRQSLFEAEDRGRSHPRLDHPAGGDFVASARFACLGGLAGAEAWLPRVMTAHDRG